MKKLLVLLAFSFLLFKHLTMHTKDDYLGFWVNTEHPEWFISIEESKFPDDAGIYVTRKGPKGKDVILLNYASGQLGLSVDLQIRPVYEITFWSKELHFSGQSSPKYKKVNVSK